MATHVVGQIIAQLPGLIEAGIIEHIPGAHQSPISQLEAQGNNPGRAVKATGGGLGDGHRHQGAVMRSPHPALDNMRHGKGLQHLPHRRECPLATDDAHRVILADILAGNQGQALRRRDGPDFAVFGIDALDDISAGGADEDQQVVGLGRGVEENALAGFDVVDFKAKAVVHTGGDDESGGIEGVGEDFEEGQVPGPGGGLVGHEDNDGLGLALLKFHFGHPGAHALDVAGEGVRQQVLAGAVQFEAFGHLGACLEDIPGLPVDLLVIHPVPMGHDELEIVAAGGDVEIDQQPLLLRLFQVAPGFFQQIRVHGGVPDIASDIGFNDA